MTLLSHRVDASLWSLVARHLAAAVAIGACLLSAPAQGQQEIRLRAQAPEGQSGFQPAPGGVFFIDKTIKEEYNRILFRIRALQSDLDAGRITSAESLAELKHLQSRLERLQKEIETKKTFVSMGKIREQTETVTFDLGPERLLVITADSVRIEGWDGPQVKCVVEKRVLVPDADKGESADEQLQSIRVIHTHGLAPKLVGRPPAEREADEQKYLAGPKGNALTEEEREVRRLVKAHEGQLYRAFQGKELDTVAIGGIREQEGNRRIEMTVSGNREQYIAIEMQRHASLTVYVPPCKAVALTNCKTGLDVQSVHGDLLVEGWGAMGMPPHDGIFRIRDLHGSLTISGLSAQSLFLDSIHGNVWFPPAMTQGLSQTGPSASYVGGQKGDRLIPPRPMSVLTCRNIDGDFTASFLQAELHLDAVAGKIDIRNEFGNTTLAAERALARNRHRVVSESGRIEARFTSEGLGDLPINALTTCGTVRTNAPYSVLEDVGDTTWPEPDGTQCRWHGMMSRFADRFDGLFRAVPAIRSIVNGEDDSPGVDLISRCGLIQILYEPGAERR